MSGQGVEAFLFGLGLDLGFEDLDLPTEALDAAIFGLQVFEDHDCSV